VVICKDAVVVQVGYRVPTRGWGIESTPPLQKIRYSEAMYKSEQGGDLHAKGEIKMNKTIQAFLGNEIVAALPSPAKINPLTLGEPLPNNITESVSQTREITVDPPLAGRLLMSNEWFTTAKGRIPNRTINESRALGELTLLVDLMVGDEFAPHRSTLGITEDGRVIEGQGRLLAQLKSKKTYTYVVDIVKNDQRSISQYLGSTWGTTAPTTLAQLWEITFGLTKKQATIAQQMFNGVLWHDEGILGTGLRTSTKAAVCQQETLPTDIRDISYVYANSRVPKGVNASALATIELLATRKGHSLRKIETFRTGILTGTELKARDPRFVVREFLMKRDKGKPIRYQAQIAYIKSAFDKFITNSEMSKVSAPDIVKF
jgi:hypothetical protein